jgi:Bacterial PH domain
MHGVPHGLADAVLSWLLETAVKAALPKAVKYKVRYRICRPGHQRTFDSLISGYARLGAMVEGFVTRAQLPKVLASFGSGEVVRFGELQIGQDGLTYASAKRRRFLPLSALARVSVTRYAVKVHQAGHRLSWLTAERAAIPNAAVLARLAEHVVAARDAHDSNEADDRNEAARSLTRHESHREHFGTERADHNPPRDGDRQPIT